MDLREIGWSGMNQINPAQNRDQWMTLMNILMNLRVFMERCEILE
jgi:hypothetical protein